MLSKTHFMKRSRKWEGLAKRTTADHSVTRTQEKMRSVCAEALVEEKLKLMNMIKPRSHVSEDEVPQIEPWPPPVPTDQAIFTIDANSVKTVGSFADAVMRRLNSAGMRHLRFWGAPHGVAVVAPLESIDGAGHPLKSDTSAVVARADPGGPVSAILAGFRQLLSQPIRNSRILLFVLTDDSDAKSPDVTMTAEIARQWTRNEYMWPTVNRDVQITDQHFVVVNVYEFHKRNKGDPELLTEDRKLHSVAEHLVVSGVNVSGLIK